MLSTGCRPQSDAERGFRSKNKTEFRSKIEHRPSRSVGPSCCNTTGRSQTVIFLNFGICTRWLDEIAEKLKEGEIDVAFTYDDDYGQPYLGPNGAEGLKKVLPFFSRGPAQAQCSSLLCSLGQNFGPDVAKLRNRCGSLAAKLAHLDRNGSISSNSRLLENLVKIERWGIGRWWRGAQRCVRAVQVGRSLYCSISGMAVATRKDSTLPLLFDYGRAVDLFF